MESKIIVFGAGTVGKRYLVRCRQCHVRGLRVVDTDTKLKGTNIEGYTIENPQEVFSQPIDMVIIAVGKKYSQEIFDCLKLNYKVSGEKICYVSQTVVLSPDEIYNLGNMQFSNPILEGIIVRISDFPNMLNKDKMNTLEQFFFFQKHNAITKWLHYFEAYERFFSKYRNQDVNILEIGVCKGGSLQMWKDFFQGKSNTVKVYGIDIDPECKALESENIEILIGSQEDKGFLKEVRDKIGQVDIVIDDGGHTMTQQITSFEELFDIVKDNGVYLCEDLHTSYMKAYGGTYKGNTFIEYTKSLIDNIHAQYSECAELEANRYSESIKAISYFDSMVFIEKKLKTTKSLSIVSEEIN